MIKLDNYKKIEFKVNGRDSIIVCPKNPLPGNPWVWKTEFFEAFNFVERSLLERGWHLVYHSASDMYGCPESIEMFKEFYDYVIKEYELSEKPALFGFSRGGLYASNFALRYPEACGLLYLDAPVLDIRSWPGGKGVGVGCPPCWEECMNWYKLDEESAKDFSGNPLDHSEEIAKLGIPILLVCGCADKVVPYSENGEPFYNRVTAAGGKIKKILKPICDHHPHSIRDPRETVEFIEDAYGYKHTDSDLSKMCKGMRGAAYGDSITYGAFTAPADSFPASRVEVRWCDIVANKLGFSSLENYSISGITISEVCGEIGQPEKAIAKCFPERVDANLDIIFISGGTNDFGLSVPLGTLEDTEDISFYGALDVLCKGILYKYPLAKVVFVTPIVRFDKDKNDIGLTLADYKKAIIDVAHGRYDFAIVDGDMIDIKPELVKDRVHPNEVAHEIYAEEVLRQLNEKLFE